MKKLMALILLMVGMTIFGQERSRKQQRNDMERCTPEQRNQLQLKQMTMNLDLNEAQQKEMKVIIADMNMKKEAHRTTMKAMWEKEVKPTTDERFAMKMKMLDEQIAIKKRMEKILNPKQFEKWNDLKGNCQGNGTANQQGDCQRNQMKNQYGKYQGQRQG